ncbi:retron system putative HNH endonuclease [Azospirillum sp.]|uniref:retron system putative HNH endonuclease n=1 Tax=Azospirillum sp. TaxID=34012 RepID=UPI002637B32E|nr:retron system putative HNH endonuclease [Azospirillum sp.]
MKYSPKFSPPVEFTEWLEKHKDSKNLSWGFLSNRKKHNRRTKKKISESIRIEQGYVCAYCGRSLKIDGSDSHIDHFLPQKYHKDKIFDYQNFFVSCGKNLKKNVSKTCGHAKDNWHDMSNQDLIPSHPNCERRFHYDSTGQIKAKREDDDLATQAIIALNLDEDALKHERSVLIAGLERDIVDGEISSTTRDEEIALWRALDKDGRAKSLGHVAALYLEQELT